MDERSSLASPLARLRRCASDTRAVLGASVAESAHLLVHRCQPTCSCSRTSLAPACTGCARSCHPITLPKLTEQATFSRSQGAYLKNEPDKVPETWRALLEMLAKRQIRSVVYDKIYECVLASRPQHDPKWLSSRGCGIQRLGGVATGLGGPRLEEDMGQSRRTHRRSGQSTSQTLEKVPWLCNRTLCL